MTGTAGRSRRRDLVLRWALPLAVVLLVVAVTAATGGFRQARADAGRPAAVGEQIDLARWELTVHDAELVDTTLSGSPSDTAIRVRFTITLTGEESQSGLPYGLLAVIAPDGSTADEGYQIDPQRGPGLDPGVTREYVVDFRFPAPDENGDQAPLGTVPTEVSVVVHDEEYGEGSLFGPSWGVADVAAVVTVPVVDRRTGA